MTGIKRLSPRQSRKVNTLVKKECCNCENGNCILLDDGDTCVCPQLISYANNRPIKAFVFLNSGLAAIHRLYYMFAKERGIFFDAKPDARYHNGA